MGSPGRVMGHIGRDVVVVDEVDLVLVDVVVPLLVAVFVVLDKLVETVIDLTVEVAPGLEILRAITNAAVAVASNRIASRDKNRHAGEHGQQ